MVIREEINMLNNEYKKILEKQIPDISEDEIDNFFDVIESCHFAGSPIVFLGDNKDLFLKWDSGRTEIISKSTVKDILDFEKFVNFGQVTSRRIV